MAYSPGKAKMLWLSSKVLCFSPFPINTKNDNVDHSKIDSQKEKP